MFCGLWVVCSVVVAAMFLFFRVRNALRWLDSTLGPLHRMDVNSVSDVSAYMPFPLCTSVRVMCDLWVNRD
jgi:hypothetical protein